MPPAAGPNYKRKDANKKKKKKKKNNTTKKFLSSSIQPPHSAGEQSDGGQVSSPHPALNADKISEDNTIEKTHTPATQKQGKIEIDRGPSSQKPHEENLNSRSSSSSDNQSRVQKKPASKKHATTVADYLCQPIEPSSPEKGDHKVEDLTSKTPSIADPVKAVDQEVASQLQLNKSTNIYLQKEDEFIVPKTPLEQRVFNENVLKNNPLSKENEVQKLVSDQKDSAQSDNSLLPDSTNVKCPYCGKSSTDDDRVDELKTLECSQRQPLLPASAPQTSKRSFWKSCCGIFELFSNSRRN